jgi:Mn-dependent DtxR family transcriptional regulator
VYEAFLDKNFPLPPDQLHLSADRVEHVLDPALREALAAELSETGRDPHGREIPDAAENTDK